MKPENVALADAAPAESAEFPRRHLGLADQDIAAMLGALDVVSLDELVDQTIPSTIRQTAPLALGPALSEKNALERIRTTASHNKIFTSMIGQGYYDTLLPSVIQRNILESPAWYTAYTPYQPEISQGRLEALLNFQTMVADLTGMEIANASLLDEATAAAEGMALVRRVCQSKQNRFFIDADCHPQTIAVLQTRAEPLGWETVVGDPLSDLVPSEVFGALLQYPGSSGQVRDFSGIAAALHSAGALSVVAADLLSLALLKPPGEFGADVAIGSAQRFGVPMGFGGPHAAYIATRDEFKRALPGRLVGVSIDSRNKAVYRLALQTREQHIRREKATSNICTAQVLLAVIASMYGVYHGPEGVVAIAKRIHRHACTLAEGLLRLGWQVTTRNFFDTLSVNADDAQADVIGRARAKRINLRAGSNGHIGISCDEATTQEIVDAVLSAFGPCQVVTEDGGTVSMSSGAKSAIGWAIPPSLVRRSSFMTHPVFRCHRSETDLLRYMRRLADRDLALDRTMIPLGSCTMKLNATTEMIPVTWPEFSQLHPFAPRDQVQGYAEMLAELSNRLCEITGYDAVSLQPNSGAQGEFAGLLAIRAYHRHNGAASRDVCLIPTSAHGTNPASAQMAGMSVVALRCDDMGNIDLSDLRAKVASHADRLAAIMITYPSTHGVFEEQIREICSIVHDHGGQVYLDGANLNAQVGLCRPGDYGADVSHINLHKTFCIPHGGGGPGMGPIAVKSHLAPFLPSHPERGEWPKVVGPVSAAPFGSASILCISWGYILMMGGEGLTRATQCAILNANYIAHQLAGHFQLLFKGKNGRVAHECILDVRQFKETAGVTVSDIAKRLIDYGFHAPTVSFPIAGTLMVEPTESESKAELDRFCDAMIGIRAEIRALERGHGTRADSPLGNAPHTLSDLVDGEWKRAYSRQQAYFPLPVLRGDKYLCPVNRIDDVYGDRNLICSCPPMDQLEVAE